MLRMRIGTVGAVTALATSVALLMCIVGVQGGLLGKLQRALVDVRASYFEIRVAPGSRYYEGDPVVERMLAQISCVESVSKARNPTRQYVIPSPSSSQQARSPTREHSIPSPGSSQRLTLLEAVGPGYFEAKGLVPASGRFFTEDEMETGALVCVVGAKASRKLGVSVGSYITFDPQQGFRAPVRVIGVLQEIDESRLEEGLSFPENWRIFIPWNSAPSYAGSYGIYYVVVPKMGLLEEAVRETREVLKSLLGSSEEFFIAEPTGRQLAYTRMVRSYIGSYLWVVIVGVVVGSLNVSSVVATLRRSRQRESAIKRAIGASRFDLMLEYALEAVGLSVVGTVLGVIIGFGVSPWLARLVNETWSITFKQVVSVVLVSVGVSSLMAIWPPAAFVKRDPVESIRGADRGRGKTVESRALSAMAVIGVAAAVMAAVVVRGIGERVRADVASLMRRAGAGTLLIQEYDPFEAASLNVTPVPVTPQTYDSIKNLEGVLGFESAFLTTFQLSVSTERGERVLPVVAVTPRALELQSFRTVAGSLDLKAGQCVVGDSVARKMFGHAEKALGCEMSIGDRLRAVVTGVLEPVPRGIVSSAVEPDDAVFVSLDEASSLLPDLGGSRGSSEILVRLESEDRIEECKNQLVSILPNYKIVSPFKVVDTFRQVHEATASVFGVFTGIILLTSGVGIANYVTVEILQAMREIGILRSIGATARKIGLDVLKQASFISIAGGLAGLAVSVLVLSAMGNPLTFVQISKFLGQGLGASAVTGLVFSAGSAYWVANLDSADLLRMEE